MTLNNKEIIMKRSILLLFLLITFKAYVLDEEGMASWYGPNFHGKKTANGEIYNQDDLTAAHRIYPFGSIVKVISLENNKCTFVRINDRGPFAKDRIIDLSRKAAEQLDMVIKGTMKVKTVLIEKGNDKYHKYTGQKYKIQIASFSDMKKAESLYNELKKEFINIDLKKVFIKQYYYRIIIDDLNYSELQINRIKLHKIGLDKYLILKKI